MMSAVKGLPMLIVTTNDIPGYPVVKVAGLVRGITVRSRSIIGMRLEANEIMDGITKVLAYGTAVVVEKV